jgi:hypothetical protein
MTPEERDLITGLFDRLKAADSPDKDREAEDLIRRQIGEHPAAPYLLTQTVLVQEQALRGAETRIATLEKQLADAQRNSAAPSSSGGSFLGRVRRPWDTAAPAPNTPSYQPPYQPQAAQPAYQPGYAAPAGGGFLQNAMATAAGVAGGALLFEGIERMMGHGSGPFGGSGFGGGGLGNGLASSPWGNAQTAPVENVTVNNYYGDAAPGGEGPQTKDADYQTADFDTTDDSDGGDSGSDVDYT